MLKLSHPLKKTPIIMALGIGVFMLIFLGLLLPYWGFDVDDGGLIWAARLNSWDDFWRILFKEDLWLCELPSNVDKDLFIAQRGLSFFSSGYRPFMLLFFSWQKLFFQEWAYGYFLITIILHSLCATFFAYVLYRIFDLKWAVLGGLLFGFHASYESWLGWIGTQQYSLSLLLLFLALFLFFKHLANQKIVFFLGAVLCYFIAVFLMDTILIVPLFLLMIYWIRNTLRNCFGLKISDHFSMYLLKIIPFFMVNICYFIMKFLNTYMLGFNVFHANPSLGAFYSNFRKMLYFSGRSFLTDFFKISIIPNGTMTIKLSIIIACIIGLVFLFYKTPYKKIILILFCIGISLLWPCLIFYSSRYLYYFLPFFITGILFLFQALKKRTQRVLVVLLSIWCMSNVYLIHAEMKIRGKWLYIFHNALLELRKNPIVCNRKLCFAFLPEIPCIRYKWNQGFTQSCWLYNINQNQAIYCDLNTIMRGKLNSNGNDVTVVSEKNKSELIFKINNRNLIPLGGLQDNELYGMGRFEWQKTGVSGKYLLHNRFKDQNILFVVWDYTKNKFHPINS